MLLRDSAGHDLFALAAFTKKPRQVGKGDTKC
jgi:hypothetical protein